MESWQTIPSFPDYAASTLGQIRRETPGRGVRAGRILKPMRNPNGYWAVTVYLQGVLKRRTVHSLVAEAFHGPRPLGSEVNHDDGDKANNAPSNLVYSTSSENKLHASATGLAASGIRNGAAKLTDEQVAAIRAACAGGRSQRAVAAEFGVSQGHVSYIVTGRSRTT